MTRGVSPNSLRQALGVIKDSTTVSLARVKKDYKELHVNIVKATSHIEQPAKEKHIRAISTTRPRADVAYCIHALERRLSKTHNWAVALKTLILIHRALKEVDPTFQEELVNYRMNNPTFLNLSHFKDYSNANACDYSYWIRMYASYMEQRLKCFRVLKYDLQTERSRTRDLDTPELFKHLQNLQTLIIRILACKPIGAAVYNFVIRLALSMVASDSVKVYKAVSDATQNLVDKFFEMNQQDGFEAVDMYRRAGAQALSLSKFYETCKSFDIGCADGFIEIEPPSSSFIQVMEQYLEGLTCDSTVKKDLSVEENHGEILTIQHKKEAEIQAEPPPDLLSLDDPVEEADEQSANSVDKTAEWELALVSSPNSTEIAKSSTKLGTGLDKLTLYNLYNDAIKKTNQTMGYNPWDQHGPMMPPQTAPNPFHTFNMMVAPHMAPMDPLMPHQGSNPFANSYEDNTCIPHPYNTSVLVQPYNQYKCGPYMV